MPSLKAPRRDARPYELDLGPFPWLDPVHRDADRIECGELVLDHEQRHAGSAYIPRHQVDPHVVADARPLRAGAIYLDRGQPVPRDERTENETQHTGGEHEQPPRLGGCPDQDQQATHPGDNDRPLGGPASH